MQPRKGGGKVSRDEWARAHNDLQKQLEAAVGFRGIATENSDAPRRAARGRSHRRRSPLITPRIILVDIETAPLIGYAWDIYNRHGGRHIIEVRDDWFILSFAYKVLGEKKVRAHTLPEFPGYASDKENDKKLVEKLWSVLDEADVVVAHNAQAFDIRKSNARFIYHGLGPPRPYQTVDTLRYARRYFKFDSNKLDDLGHYLKVGRKLPHTGKALWLGCMAGDRKAWRLMRRYNIQDVALLERVYRKLAPWSVNHPNLNFITRRDACPVCQSSKYTAKGWHYLRTGKRQRCLCLSCGHRFTHGPLVR